MHLHRENIKRPFFDFSKATGDVNMGMLIDEKDLKALIRYMESNQFKLGLDFVFVMGVDAPDRKYLAAIPTASKMLWYTDNTHDDEHPPKEQFIQLCIKMMKEDLEKTDHLEVWDDVEAEAPFYKGQKVRGKNALEGSRIKNGQEYTISTCHYSECKGNWFWYVGVEGVDNDWMTPRLFEPV